MHQLEYHPLQAASNNYLASSTSTRNKNRWMDKVIPINLSCNKICSEQPHKENTSSSNGVKYKTYKLDYLPLEFSSKYTLLQAFVYGAFPFLYNIIAYVYSIEQIWMSYAYKVLTYKTLLDLESLDCKYIPSLKKIVCSQIKY